MIEMLLHSMSSSQGAYQALEATYNAGPDILNSLLISTSVFLGVVLVKVTFFSNKR